MRFANFALVSVLPARDGDVWGQVGGALEVGEIRNEGVVRKETRPRRSIQKESSTQEDWEIVRLRTSVSHVMASNMFGMRRATCSGLDGSEGASGQEVEHVTAFPVDLLLLPFARNLFIISAGFGGLAQTS